MDISKVLFSAGMMFFILATLSLSFIEGSIFFRTYNIVSGMLAILSIFVAWVFGSTLILGLSDSED
jgi:hypothetical protein